MEKQRADIIVIGGGHAGAEAAWAAANLLSARSGSPRVALVTLDPAKIGVMSCNPAIGGLAKGQLVREIDAMAGLMGLAADATGIHFKMLNTSKGPAVRGPRCQSDKHAYAEAVQAMIASRPEISVVAGAVGSLLVEDGRVRGVTVGGERPLAILAPAVVLTTGTFMRGLMHTGEQRTPGGRRGEAASSGMSAALHELGFELGRLKTGTPPRLRRSSIDWDGLEAQPGDAEPAAFSALTGAAQTGHPDHARAAPSLGRFPVLEQVECRRTSTTAAAHDAIRANLHRAPMYSGAIESVGPRYCPSIEDKVVRFADRESHGVFLEPESLRTDWIYCNGISSSLPGDVQDRIVRSMPGCERAEILQYGYAVEYDMVRPHQIHATGETKLIAGLFLAGQINGTSGYEEAAAQGLIAGINAALLAAGEDPTFTLGRDEAYAGVLMDDLVTKTPVEPYRMFTSRAEHRLLLRADNASDRLTPIAERLGLLERAELGQMRARRHSERTRALLRIAKALDARTRNGSTLAKHVARGELDAEGLRSALPEIDAPRDVWFTAWADARYAPYIARQRSEIKRHAAMEHRRVPGDVDYTSVEGLRSEARDAMARFRPATFGQAARLEGVTPADLTLLSVHLRKRRGAQSLASAIAAV